MKRDFQSSLIIGLALTLGAVITVFIGFVVFLKLDAPNITTAKLPSHSMAPGLLAGDYITWTRFVDAARTADSLHRGDVVVFLSPDDATQQLKRVVGLSGDTIAMKEAVLQLNGLAVREPYASKADSSDSTDPVADEFRWQRPYVIGAGAVDTSRYVPSRDNWGPLVVPPHHYFVLGDLRDESLDSRYLGFVAANQVLGRARRVYFSRDDSTGDIRWSRIGHRIR